MRLDNPLLLSIRVATMINFIRIYLSKRKAGFIHKTAWAWAMNAVTGKHK